MSTINETKGGWITYTDWKVDCRPMIFHPIAFRKDFTLATKAVSGTLAVSAADKYALWLNGRFLGCGPARSYPREKLYDEYDITPYLRKGINRFAVLILPCTGANFLGNYTRMGLFLQAEVKLAGGGRVLLASDETWHCRVADWIKHDYLLISLPIAAQEHVDKDREDEKWKVRACDKSWTPALYLGPAGCPPWIHLVPRPIPLLREKPLTPDLVWRGRGDRTMVETDRNLAALFNCEALEGKPVPEESAGGVFDNAGDNILVFDFGRTRLVRPALDIENVSGPVRFELYYDTKLGKRPTAAMGFRSPMEGGSDSCLMSRGRRRWELLVPRGFRFMTVKLTGPGRARFRLACRSVDYPYEDNARFESSDSFLARSWEISKNNIRSSTNDAVVDCCNRENLVWTFDACVTLKAAFYSFGETRMWRRCLDLIAQGVDPDGRPSAVTPTDVPSSLFGQQMHWVVALGEYYMATGDRTLLESAAAAVRRYLSLCAKNVTDEDLFVAPAWSWHWVDWAPLDLRPYSLPVNALLVMACDAAARIARIIGDRELGRLSETTGRRVRKAISHFFDARKGAFRSRLVPRRRLRLASPKPNSRTSELAMTLTHNVHSNILAVLAGCGTAAMRRLALRHAAACLAQPPNPSNEIGTGYVDVLLSPLIAAGHTGAAMSKIKSIYQPFLDIGAPTWGENASPAQVFNTAHGWSAAVNSLIAERVVGLRPSAPGWKGILLDPVSGIEADFAYGLETPAGLVRVESSSGRVDARWPKGIQLVWCGKTYAGTGGAVHLKRPRPECGFVSP